MEHKIGEIFEYNGEWYQCIVGNGCENCAFNERKCYTVVDNGDPIKDCCADRRKDNKDVIFKKLEKVGEPFTLTIHVEERLVPMQEYTLYDVNFCEENSLLMYVSDYKHKRIAIEIKQNKEDMEEKKIQHYDCFFDKEQSKPNLKPFSLKLAKQGKSVCTRDGKKARIICFDAKSSKPIIALIKRKYDDYEENYSFYENGRVCRDKDNDYDLMMLPERKEGWVNIVRGSDGSPHMGRGIFQSKEEAENTIKAFSDNLIDTVKICWEE